MTKINVSKRELNRAALAFLIGVATLLLPALCRAQGYTITTVAGNGSQTYSGDGGPAMSAGLVNPSNVALDSAGNVYIADTGSGRIRMVSAAGTITTVAGGGACGNIFCGDGGPATSARLNGPEAIAIDTSGDLYISDTGNEVIRKVSPSGIITTIAGGGSALSDGVPATQAELLIPWGIAIDTAGNLYIAELGSGSIRKVPPSGVITTVASGLNMPEGVAVDAASNIYYTSGDAIQKVAANGVITTVAGGSFFGLALFSPGGVAVDASGDLFIADTYNERILEMPANGPAVLIAGNGTKNYAGDGGPATSAELSTPTSITVGASGDIYIADTGNGRIRLLTPAAGSQAPAVTQVQNAEGGSATTAPNTWVAIKGSGLAPAGDSRIWQGSDFVNGQLPTQLDGVSVTMNGENAYVYYISPSQVNVLTPPDLALGVVQVKVTTGGVTSAQFTSLAAKGSPSFFIFGAGPYIVATHANGSLIGPASLYPGLSTPAAPGELIVLYANGFGAVSPAVVAGSETQSGTLPTPLVEIGSNGGLPASVQFAGLVSPGLYQFNVVVPASTPDGDNPIIASLPGVLAGTTQSGVLLTVQH